MGALVCGALSLHTAQAGWVYSPVISSTAKANSPTISFNYFVGTEDSVYLGIVLVGKNSCQLDVHKSGPDAVERMHKNHCNHLDKIK